MTRLEEIIDMKLQIETELPLDKCKELSKSIAKAIEQLNK